MSNLAKKRRSTANRAYGSPHQVLRKQFGRIVAGGNCTCARCGLLIIPDEPWDLDHRDDRRGYLGPSHARCNRSTAKARRVSRQW